MTLETWLLGEPLFGPPVVYAAKVLRPSVCLMTLTRETNSFNDHY